MSKLDGLRVLATRPAGRETELVTAIREQGGKAVNQPLLEIAPLHPVQDASRVSAARACFDRLSEYRHIIFISVNAVEFAWPMLEQQCRQLPPQARWYAIGKATAKALREHGVTAEAPDETMNSEALLALPALADVDGHNCLIVRGVGGRETLAATLRERGARVDYAECYRRHELSLPADALCRMLESEHIDAVCLNSEQTAAAFDHNVGTCRERAQDIALVVPGERVAQAARQQGYRRVIVADNAGVEATVAALSTLRP